MPGGHHMNPRWISVIVFTITLCFGRVTLYGQAVSGTINGYVTDASNAPVANASVVVLNERTGVRSQVLTSPEGFFNATNLQPGKYSVSAEQAGFSKITREHVNLEVDAT